MWINMEISQERTLIIRLKTSAILLTFPQKKNWYNEGIVSIFTDIKTLMNIMDATLSSLPFGFILATPLTPSKSFRLICLNAKLSFSYCFKKIWYWNPNYLSLSVCPSGFPKTDNWWVKIVFHGWVNEWMNELIGMNYSSQINDSSEQNNTFDISMD